jgi:hypothetical protein
MSWVLAFVLSGSATTSDSLDEHLLRMSYQKDATYQFVIESTHTTQGSAPATVRLNLTRTVIEVRGARARVETRLDGIDFGQDDPRNPLFAKLIGSAWRGWVDDRGRFEAMTLVPPKELPRLLLPMADQLKRLLPGRSLPLPAEAQRIGDDWRIPAKDLAASPDGSWAKAATGGLQCKLVQADSKRATIEITLDTPLGSQKVLSGSGKMVVNLSNGVLESFRLKNRLSLMTKVAGDTSKTEIDHEYRLTSRPGANP